MKTNRDVMNERMDAFGEACARLGLKVTHQRTEIFRVVASTEDHPDAVFVHREVQKKIPAISLDTVYRNLKLLAERGLLSIVGMSQENLRFDANLGPHHHFSCVRCGMIRDFSSEGLGALPMPEEAKDFGEPVSLHLEVKGVCAACRRKGRGNKTRTED